MPPPNDTRSWHKLWAWLGDDAHAMTEGGAVQVCTPEGWAVAQSGDWIVLSVSGDFHVAHTGRTMDA